MSGDPHLWKRFIRDTLGCGCPDEVFEKIDITPIATDQSTGSSALRINVGDRLLIYIAEDMDKTRVINLLRTGVAERNTGGFNRFRLVVGRNSALPDPAHVQSLTAALFPGDEKVHLHLLPIDTIAELKKHTRW